MSNLKLVVYNSVMEFANQPTDVFDANVEQFSEIRLAQESDAVSISRLLNSTRFSHIHVDWHLPGDWLGDAGFLALPDRSDVEAKERPRLIEARERILACLAVTADPPPAAWVRLTAVSPELDVTSTLGALFARVQAQLCETGINEVGWLIVNPWPLPYLAALGFEPLTTIETYRKEGLEIPTVKEHTSLHVRTVKDSDYVKLAVLEKEVFEPLWRLSADTLRLARREALSFDVAYLDDRLVGYQISTGGRFGAHLVRVCIAPDVQGQGVGTSLLAHTIREYRAHNFDYVTLNTQVDNPTSHHLYEKFGFEATGEKMPLWVMTLA